MDRCTDERIGRKLYAYELGQLSDDECREVEIHLFECEYCYQRSLKFQDSVRMMRSDAGIRDEVERLAEEASEELEEVSPTDSRHWPKIVRLSLAAAAAVLVLLLLKPWDLEFHFTKEAVAYENILAVMYFDNMAEPRDDSRLGEIVTDMVITDLATSDYMHVMSSQRLYDLLKSIGHEGEKSFGRSIATEVAKKGRARWMMTGGILQREPTIVLSAQIVDVGTGNVIEARRVSGEEGENVFAVVDRLTSEVRTALRIPHEDIKKHDRAIADITTNSLEAYGHYIKGLEYYYRHITIDARLQFEKAYEVDSTFAMAYYMWTRCWIENNIERKAAIDAAMKYIDRANDIQQRYIRARHAEIYEDYETAINGYKEIIAKYPDEKWAYYFLGAKDYPSAVYYDDKTQEAIDLLLKAVEIDPGFKRAYSELYYRYVNIGQRDRAQWAFDKYVELSPGDPGPYLLRGSKYRLKGEFEEALAAYRKALEISPDHINALINIGNIYHFMRDFEHADSVYTILANHRDPDARAYARLRLTQTPRAQGKFKKAIEMLEEGIETDFRELGPSLATAFKYGTLSYDYSYFLHDYDKAIEVALRDADQNKQVGESWFANQGLGNLASFYAVAGQFDKADSLIDEIKAYYDSSYLEPDPFLDFYIGTLDYEKGNYDSAIVCYKSCLHQYPVLTVLFELGRSYYGAGKIDSAILAYKRALRSYEQLAAWWPETVVATEYELGKAYEGKGENDIAIAQYETFLDLWKDADSGLSMVEDARARLGRLKSRP